MLLRSADGPAARSLELVIVTSRVERSLVARLLERALTRRPVALVHVEAASFVGRPHRPDPELLRLQAAGVPIAVVRQGDDLAAALRGASTAEVARA
jgi:riboflavin biosynthesis pyrimidine reductase